MKEKSHVDVFLYESIDDRIKVTPLAWYLLEDEARKYVHNYVAALEESE